MRPATFTKRVSERSRACKSTSSPCDHLLQQYTELDPVLAQPFITNEQQRRVTNGPFSDYEPTHMVRCLNRAARPVYSGETETSEKATRKIVLSCEDA